VRKTRHRPFSSTEISIVPFARTARSRACEPSQRSRDQSDSSRVWTAESQCSPSTSMPVFNQRSSEESTMSPAWSYRSANRPWTSNSSSKSSSTRVRSEQPLCTGGRPSVVRQ